ncbi:hypothetical protein [Alcaligenes aquatilis]|uniref:Uncharacterized protein n=1 Tax=Alcaligenes aquatilis TaxID=323284 RepID=A0A3G2HX01_9BURK|nr:hypothetical protein [Alcaligenes aquatilis]AYN21595.1 hypothetical protein D3M96_14280 [Alcaligenes aquatilis]
MQIEFVKNCGPYSPGDVAGFGRLVAEDLVASGVAVVKQWDDAPTPDVTAGDANDDMKPSAGRSRRKP